MKRHKSKSKKNRHSGHRKTQKNILLKGILRGGSGSNTDMSGLKSSTQGNPGASGSTKKPLLPTPKPNPFQSGTFTGRTQPVGRRASETFTGTPQPNSLQSRTLTGRTLPAGQHASGNFTGTPHTGQPASAYFSQKLSKALVISTPDGTKVERDDVYIGEVIPQYLTEIPYDTAEREDNVYSDHAPIKYVIDGKTIITWNIGQWGCFGPYTETNTNSDDEGGSLISIYDTIPGVKYTYNHKFNGIQLETSMQYLKRLENIAAALQKMRARNPDAIFLLQELPTPIINESRGPFPVAQLHVLLPIFYRNIGIEPDEPVSYKPYNDIINTCINIFGTYLRTHGLKIINSSGSSMVVNLDDTTFTHYLLAEEFAGMFAVATNDGGITAFQDTKNPSTLYISTHIRYKSYLNTTTKTKAYDDVSKLKTVLAKYKTQIAAKNRESGMPPIKTLLFCGDFNMPKKLIDTAGFKIYTTPHENSYSLGDNAGKRNSKNIDLVVKVDL
jgi:hypothetical protein